MTAASILRELHLLPKYLVIHLATIETDKNKTYLALEASLKNSLLKDHSASFRAFLLSLLLSFKNVLPEPNQ